MKLKAKKKGHLVDIYKYNKKKHTLTHTHIKLTFTYNISRQEGTIWKDMQLPIESAFFSFFYYFFFLFKMATTHTKNTKKKPAQKA